MSQAREYFILDAYNILHADVGWRALFRENFASGCQALVDAARLLHDFEPVHVIVVFDGNRDRVEIEHPDTSATFELVYSSNGVSADTLIERLTQKIATSELCTVVSADGAVGLATRANHGYVVSPQEFEHRVRQCEQRMHQDLRSRRNAALENRLPGLDE